MKRLSTALLLICTVFIGLRAANPDFTHPQTTIANAEKNYKAAIKSPKQSGVKLIKSLLEISGATAAIDPDSLPTVLPRIDRAIDACPDGEIKALAMTVKADIVYAIYNQNRWRYDRNQTPDEPLPADISEWNGRQFRSQISSVMNAAFDLIAAAPSAKLTNFSDIIEADRQTLYFHPTVCDFVALKAVDIFNSIGERDVIKTICDRMIDLSRYESAPWFWWSVETINNNDLSYGTQTKNIISLYLDHKGCEDAGYALIEVANENGSIRTAPDWLLQSLKDFINDYPDYILINTIKNRLTQLTNPYVNISANNIVAPSTPFVVKVSYDFVNNCGFTIYSISKTTYDKRGSGVIAKIQNISFKTDPSKFNCDTTISVSLPDAGYYKIVPTSNIVSNQKSNIYLQCTPFIPIKISSERESAFTIVDYTTGTPMEGVTVKETSKYGNRYFRASDKDGIIHYTEPQVSNNHGYGNREYIFSYNGHDFNFFNSYISSKMKLGVSYKSNIFTDRELYHPGDTVKWAATLYETTEEGQNKLTTGKKVQLIFYDANNNEVGTTTSTTDDFGRIHGEFVIPDEGLTGSFRLSILQLNENNKQNNPQIGNKYITVSDFKLPTFKVDSLTVELDRPSKDEVTLGGKAVTYSGMPVSGAKVQAVIKAATRWRWFVPAKELGTVEAVTDADGHFSFVVGDSLLSLSTSKCYVAEIVVTSSAGESQHASKSFTTGKPYTIDYNSGNTLTLINSDEEYQLPISVYDADGNAVDGIELKWWLNENGAEEDAESNAVASGIITSGKGEIVDLHSVKSGRYTLSIVPTDTALANEYKTPGVELYSISRNTMPMQRDIFIITTQYICDDNGEAEIIFGTPRECFVYSVLGALENIVSINVAKYSAGFHRIKLRIPEEAKEGLAYLYTTSDGDTDMNEIRIIRPDRSKITLEGTSMRDRLSPGTPERWTLKLTDVDGKPIAGAMVATMFNSALNAIEGYSMPSNFNIYRRPIGLDNRIIWINELSGRISGNLNFLETLKIGQPDFNPSLSYSSLRNYGYILRKSRAYTSGANTVTTVLVTEDEAFFQAENAKGFIGSSSGIVDSVVAEDKEYTMSIAENDEYEEEAITEGSGAVNQQPQFEYRPSEVLQAFWMPNLLIDENGEAEIAFTVPNANTTWSMNAFAWTKDLRVTTMVREFTAAKPVMVQPNLPRFLRAGDKAHVLATVFNNSDERAPVTTVIELFDFSTGKVYATAQSTDIIAPAASAVASIMIEASGDASVIGYRVRSTLGKFTDGEQAYIPVEAATSDVIESEVFYLNPGDNDYSMTLPKGKNMQSTLDYTDNPAWNIIKQLPGLAQCDAKTSTGAAYQLFGAATAAGMLKAYPAIAEVLRVWNENPDSKALTSRLSQNDELKAAVLSETPWVQAAASDSHRMVRLNLLFDKKATSGTIDATIATLRKLQRADGGWSWGAWSEKSSLWATSIVLQQLGRLRVAGYLPSGKGLEKMIDDGITYYESQLDKYETTDRALAFIVSMFPDHNLSLRGTQVVNATLQAMMSGWKSASTWNKAMDAIILNKSGYPNVAKEIIGSLREFAVASPSRGTSFPSVDNINDYADLLYAFASIEPKAPEIDGMRQWLVIRDQATEQLGSYDPTRIIAAFTACGSQWLNSAASHSTIAAGGVVIPTDSAEAVTGHIICALPPEVAGKELTVARGDTAVPAYGSVISRFAAESSDIKASSCADLSVEKRITALRNGKWQYVDSVAVGEQVKVVLTIKAKRDLEYVTVIDGRPASFEPVDQLPGWVWSGGAGFYRENRDSETRLFINYLSQGTYQITIDMTASIEGTFTSGIATVQSQLAPSITAHSAGTTLLCLPQ